MEVQCKPLPLSLIRVDGGTQIRARLVEHTVNEYSEAMQEGARFPPVSVCYDGREYWLWDGFHRLAAAERSGRATIEAEISPGTRRDALFRAIGANARHGLPRTNEDKRRAVLFLLEDAEWQAWSDGEIARVAAVSQPFVSALRRRLSQNDFEIEQRLARRGDTVYPISTGPIGKPNPSDAPLSAAIRQDPAMLDQIRSQDPAAFDEYLRETTGEPIVREIQSAGWRALDREQRRTDVEWRDQENARQERQAAADAANVAASLTKKDHWSPRVLFLLGVRLLGTNATAVLRSLQLAWGERVFKAAVHEVTGGAKDRISLLVTQHEALDFLATERGIPYAALVEEILSDWLLEHAAEGAEPPPAAR